MFVKASTLLSLAALALAAPHVPRDKTASTFHPATDATKCMGIKGGKYYNGAPVDVYDCNGSLTQQWSFNSGHGQISSIDANGQAWCVDAGDVSALKNGAELKIWQCYDNLPQQQWSYEFITRSVKLNAGSGDLCLELPHGAKTNQNILTVSGCVNTPRWDDSNPTLQQWQLPDFWWWPF